MSDPKVTAVIVTFGHADEIGACLDALLDQEVTGGLEVVVVDNASTDGTSAVIQGYADRGVTLVVETSNTGYAAATNTAAAMGKGELLLLLNPDCVVDPGCVQTLVDHLEATPGVGAASALLHYPDGSQQAFCRRDLTLGLVLWDLTSRGRRWDRTRRADRGRRWRRYATQIENPPTEPWDVDCPAAACVLLWAAPVRKQVMAPELALFFNDGDLFDRLRAKGYVVQVVPAATAAHGYSTSLQRLPDARRRAEFVVGMRLWARRWWPLRRRVALTLLLLLDAVLSRGHWRRGTLGGLGLPGGAHPWLSSYPSLKRRLHQGAATVRESAWTWFVQRRHERWGKRAIRRWKREARLNRARIVVHAHPTAQIAPDVVVEIRRGQVGHINLGPHCVLHSGVVVRLWGGELEVGHGAQVRHGTVLTVKGRMRLGARTLVSRGVNLHADGTFITEFGVTFAEGVTAVDSTHVLGTTLPVFDLPTVQKDIYVGAGAFIGANAVINAGVSLGRRAVVGAGCVVTRDVRDGAFVVGVAARERPVS